MVRNHQRPAHIKEVKGEGFVVLKASETTNILKPDDNGVNVFMTDELKTCRHCEAIIPEGRRFCDAHYQLECEKMYEKEIAEYERAYQTYLDELAALGSPAAKDKDDIAAAKCCETESRVSHKIPSLKIKDSNV